MTLVEKKNQNPFTKLHTLVSTIKWQKYYQKLKFWTFHHSIDEAQWFVASSLNFIKSCVIQDTHRETVYTRIVSSKPFCAISSKKVQKPSSC